MNFNPYFQQPNQMQPQFDYQNYQNQLNQQYQQLQNMQQANQRTILDRVQGEAMADVYPVNAGQEVILFDMDNPFVYHKVRGNDNKLVQKRFRLVEDEKQNEVSQPQIDLSGYVREEEISQIVADAVEKKMSEYTLKPTKKPKQVEED